MTSPGATVPSPQRPWAAGIGTAVALGVFTMVLAIAGAIFVLDNANYLDEEGNSSITNVVRSAFAAWAALVVVAVAIITYLGPRLAGRGSLGFWMAMSAAGYALNLSSWVGTAIGLRNVLNFGDMGEEPGIGLMALGWLMDLVLWMGVSFVAISLALRSRERVS